MYVSVLVCAGHDTFTQVDMWAREVRSKSISEDVIIMLVGNKADLADSRWGRGCGQGGMEASSWAYQWNDVASFMICVLYEYILIVIYYALAKGFHKEFRRFGDCTATFIHWWRWLYSHRNVWILCETLWLEHTRWPWLIYLTPILSHSGLYKRVHTP